MKIICITCNTPVFRFSGDRKNFSIADLEPLDGYGYLTGKGTGLCPCCGGKFYGQSLDGAPCLFFGNNNWWPHSPLDLSS